MLPQAVREYLEANREAHLKSFCELLRFPSLADETARPDPCVQAAEWVARYAKGIGIDARVVAAHGKPYVLGAGPAVAGAPTLLLYAHYDVQPAEPLELWKSSPFEPVVRGGDLFARGASDDKGPLMAMLFAVEAWQRAGGGVPVNVKLLIEGEEEIGSPTIETFMRKHRGELRADAAIVADTDFFTADLPSITYGLRGLVYFEVTLEGATQDAHSGMYGGGLVNPANALARIVADLHDADGRIMIPGFYDDVVEASEAELASWAKLGLDEKSFAATAGAKVFAGGEKGRGLLDRLWARPTADCNGLASGYGGAGSKTIIPARAMAKISCRIVPNQDPAKIVVAFREFVAARAPAGVKAKVLVHSQGGAVLASADAGGSKFLKAAGAAMAEAFGRAPAFVRCGASVPVVESIQRVLHVEPVMLGVRRPDDNLHAPNEKYALDMLWGVSRTIAGMMGEFGR